MKTDLSNEAAVEALAKKLNAEASSPEFARFFMEIDRARARKQIDADAQFAKDLAAALWERSILRHGMFTPPQFAALCESVIVEFLVKRRCE